MKFRVQLLAALAAIATLASPQAHASRARELVMGTGDAGTVLNGGSLYYDEAYNIFYNPAYLNDFRNWAIVEKSNYPGTTAQGGFMSSLVFLNYGMYVNRGNAVATNPLVATNGISALPPGVASPASGYSAGLKPTRPVEVFLGSDMGIKWGLGLTYASNVTASGDSSYVLAHLGAILPVLESFATIRLGGSEPGKSHGFYRAGFRHRWGEWAPYGVIATSNDDDGTNNLRETTWGLGLARNTKAAEGVSMNVALSYWQAHDTGATEVTRYYLPFDLSIEGDVASWLTLRGGVSYRLLDRSKTGSQNSLSIGDTTTGRLGASFHAGKFDMEWAVGKATGTIEGSTTPDTQVFDLAAGFFTAASLSYRW